MAKILRLDGINLCFVKDFSVDIKTGFMKLMMELHANNKFAKDVNNSLIVLILKNDWPQGLKDYFPISLIGYIYKVLLNVSELCKKNDPIRDIKKPISFYYY